MQKKLTILWAFAFFVLLVSWAIKPAQAHHRDGHSRGGGGGGIPLCVTISDASTDNVTSDGNGKLVLNGKASPNTYCHDEQAVDPSSFYVIAGSGGGTGDFVFAASNSSVRSIDLNFSDCVPDTVLPGNEDLCAVRDDVFDTSFSFANRDFDIRSLDPGVSGLADLFLRFNVNKQDKTFEQINFRIADGCPGNPVTVTRLDNGCWTVESTADDEACLFKKTARGRNAPIELQGKYHMPFFMTLHPFSGNFNDQGPIDVASCD